MKSFVIQNVFMIKDKCAYAYCPITDQVAFCGGIDVNFSISNDVCLINLKNSSYVVTTTTMQRIGAAAVFVQGLFYYLWSIHGSYMGCPGKTHAVAQVY